jgi:PAS domain S-box-containing protein
LKPRRDGILILDADSGEVQDANPFMHTLLGYPPGEIVGFKLWEIGPFKHIEASKTAFAELKVRDCVRYASLSLERRDGGRVEAEFISNVFVAAGRRFIQCNIRDISERKRSEEMLRLLSSAMHQTKDSVVITDACLDSPGPRILFVNPAFTVMTGYTAGELIGRTPRILQGPDTDRAVLNRLRACLTRGEVFEGETTNYRKNGEAFQIEWQITPIRDPEGIITHFGSILRDVTAVRLAQSELRASEEQFRQVVENIP